MKQKIAAIFNNHKCILYAVSFIIAAIITFTGYHYAQSIQYIYNNKKFIKRIQHVVDIVKSQYSLYTQYNKINNGYLASIAKESLQNDGLIFHYDGVISNYDGGNLLIFPSSKTTINPQPDAFVIGYGSLWRDRCIFLATYDWRKIKGVSPIAVLASSAEQYTQILGEAGIGCFNRSQAGNYSLVCANNSYSTFPMTLQEAQSACSCQYSECFVGIKFY